ncbi:MAG: YtxH domain-containing protein [Alistipes sp.]|nr:YtxH domain-containing protein [Alistipes sp.]MDE5578329.1 YtxH domain-containing protein [Alistipes sp.]MDE6710918.1 YtxH domain-containing protein [Alistipes sp.]
MKNTGIIITSLLGGLIVGSALTMLFTPQSGLETRKQIKDFLNDEIDKMKDKVEKVHEQIEEARCKCEHQ